MVIVILHVPEVGHHEQLGLQYVDQNRKWEAKLIAISLFDKG